MARTSQVTERMVRVEASGVVLAGDLALPPAARGAVLFAHGSGSSRHSPRNRRVAATLQAAGLATLLLDLLTEREDELERAGGELRFDLDLLTGRLVAATAWLRTDPATGALPVGYFGASTGAGAALMAAAERPEWISAVVSRGGRPDLAGDALRRVRAPTLLIVGGLDTAVIRLNRDAAAWMRAPVTLEIVPGATHLFEEPGTLEAVASLARDWLVRYLAPAAI
jgi:dienelactone hydrolase